MSQPEEAGATPGQDILACYLTEYAKARRLDDLERPWGLDDDGLDALWMRLAEALSRDHTRLNRLVAEELNDDDRLHIAAKLIPLLLAVPVRGYPTELAALRDGPRLMLSVRQLTAAEAGVKPRPAENAQGAAPAPRKRPYPVKVVGFLPAALAAALAGYLRQVLRFPAGAAVHEAMVSTGGRRRRIRVRLLPDDVGLVVHFLERLPSAADEGH